MLAEVEIVVQKKMEWLKLLSNQRYNPNNYSYPGASAKRAERGDFQKDYDRIVFSSPFRRLQNKTQVMPLPESDFVHTRLTHSLETSCVGRTLGVIAGTKILERHPELTENGFTASDFGDIVAAAALAHDIGNPAFGHSGEDAISEYFCSENAAKFLAGLDNKQIADLQNFEGNASGFRILTQTYPALSSIPGGLRLTYSTLATFTKYPKESLPDLSSNKKASDKKYGFFQSEKAIFSEIAEAVGMLKKPAAGDASHPDPVHYHRHPLTFLVEAADDICYRIIDFEDGCKLGLVDYHEAEALLLEILKDENNLVLNKVNFWQERIGYLRARVIQKLVKEAANVFITNEEEILAGAFDEPLISRLGCKSTLDKIKEVSVGKIYRNRPVIEIETAGFEVLGGLLDAFLGAVFNRGSRHNKKLLDLIPVQFLQVSGNDAYEKIMLVTDFVSGMTDREAISLFRKIKGISLPQGF